MPVCPQDIHVGYVVSHHHGWTIPTELTAIRLHFYVLPQWEKHNEKWAEELLRGHGLDKF